MDRLDIGRFAVRSCEWNNGGIKGRGVFISMKRTVQKSPPQRLMCSLMLLFLYVNIYTCINIYVYTYIYLGLFARPFKSSSPTPRPFRPPHQQRLHCLAPFIYSLPPLPFPSTKLAVFDFDGTLINPLVCMGDYCPDAIWSGYVLTYSQYRKTTYDSAFQNSSRLYNARAGVTLPVPSRFGLGSQLPSVCADVCSCTGVRSLIC